ncbi:Thiol-disulfide isomerase or thioredoxin [Sphingobacterium nematocida]|uniref:Thiol-disulfide isomerase or thioredoxin n=1 Tax=Sphingobacterium nematocida TaxID=1513896 RepID=A0A1T5AUC2_9SPHI|nr:TlpA disulfide reductase family protein [Sphingobacterium nematocida]SKB38536.1 Thiol-disulfide isomerase or thioredoxin [Sphingobacterium nematocida]
MKKLLTLALLYAGLNYAQEKKALVFTANDLFAPTAELADKFERNKSQLTPEERDVWYSTLAVKYTRDKNNAKAEEMIDHISSDLPFAQAASTIVGLLDEPDRLAWEERIKKRVDKVDKQSTDSKGYAELAAVYGTILMHNAKYKEALPYLALAYDKIMVRKELNRNYHYVLSLNGQYEKAFPYLEELVKTGFADEAVKVQLKKSHQALHPTADVNQYFSGLQQNLQDELKDKLTKMEVNVPVKAFTVYDVHGKSVSIHDFKGKTVVIDLWGTWCIPCMKALPAMQKVVNKFKSDNDVQFLFINTLEKGDAKKIAFEYFRKHNYEMDLYIDPMDKETKTSPAYEALGRGGMPNKIIIDRDGIIRFKTAGFMGGDDELIEELSLMIEIAKNKH